MARITKSFESDAPKHATAPFAVEVTEHPILDDQSTYSVDALVSLAFDNGRVTKTERIAISDVLTEGQQIQLATISRVLYDAALNGIVAKGPSKF